MSVVVHSANYIGSSSMVVIAVCFGMIALAAVVGFIIIKRSVVGDIHEY